MQVLLLRHGLTQGNLERRYIGSTDDPLCPQGIEKLKAHPPCLWTGPVYVTPLQRTRQTAEILFPRAQLLCVDGLAEMRFGIFENRNAAEMENDPHYRAWVDSMCLDPCPGGESQAAFVHRAAFAFEDLLSRHDPSDPLICVCHGGTIMALLSHFASPAGDYWRWHCSAGCGYIARWENGQLAEPAPWNPETGCCFVL